jgi:hypothetical protein
MEKALYDAFKKVGSRCGICLLMGIIDDGIVLIIRHEYRLSVYKVLGSLLLNRTIGKEARCRVGNSLRPNETGFFREDWTPTILPDKVKNNNIVRGT